MTGWKPVPPRGRDIVEKFQISLSRFYKAKTVINQILLAWR
jgi:hypothetical protein